MKNRGDRILRCSLLCHVADEMISTVRMVKVYNPKDVFGEVAITLMRLR